MGTDVAGVAKGNEGADDAEVADENEEHEQQRGRAFLYVMFGLRPGQTLHMYTPKLPLKGLSSSWWVFSRMVGLGKVM